MQFTQAGKAFLGGLLALCAVLPAQAEYPERPIRAIVPFATGSGNDIVARLLSPELGKILGQPVIVENKPGAGGNIGLEFVAKSKPDGYTLLFSGNASTQNPALYRSLPFDPVKDLQPVAEIGQAPYAILVNAKVPASNALELIDYARKHPGKLNAAAGGLGSRLSVEMFRIQNKITVEIIPYQGAGQTSLAVLRGEADFAIQEISAYTGYLSAGTVKAFAVAGEKRISAQPDVPTAREAGLGDYLAGAIFGLYVTGGTPPDIVQKLNAAMNRIITTPGILERLRKLGVEPSPKSVDEFTKLIHREIALWKTIARQANVPYVD